MQEMNENIDRMRYELEEMQTTIDMILYVMAEGLKKCGDEKKPSFDDYYVPHRNMVREISRILRYRMPEEFKEMVKSAGFDKVVDDD